GHAAALGYVPGELALADRARMPVHFLDTVRGPLAFEVVPHHDARGAATFGDADDVDPFHLGQMRDVKLLPDSNAFDRAAKLADEPLRFAVGLGEQLDTSFRASLAALAVELGNVTTFTAAGQAARAIVEAQLHRLVTVALFGAQLQHVARAGFDHCD